MMQATSECGTFQGASLKRDHDHAPDRDTSQSSVCGSARVSGVKSKQEGGRGKGTTTTTRTKRRTKRRRTTTRGRRRRRRRKSASEKG
eukprot:1373682-Rhodomonas_salina.2